MFSYGILKLVSAIWPLELSVYLSNSCRTGNFGIGQCTSPIPSPVFPFLCFLVWDFSLLLVASIHSFLAYLGVTTIWDMKMNS